MWGKAAWEKELCREGAAVGGSKAKKGYRRVPLEEKTQLIAYLWRGMP